MACPPLNRILISTIISECSHGVMCKNLQYKYYTIYNFFYLNISRFFLVKKKNVIFHMFGYLFRFSPLKYEYDPRKDSIWYDSQSMIYYQGYVNLLIFQNTIVFCYYVFIFIYILCNVLSRVYNENDNLKNSTLWYLFINQVIFIHTSII